VVDLGSLEEHPSNALPGSSTAWSRLLPASRALLFARAQGGFVERLQEGTWLGHVAEHVAPAAAAGARHDMRRGKTRGTGQRGQYNVIYGSSDERVGSARRRLAVASRQPPRRGRPGVRLPGELESFLLGAERTAFGPSTQAILDEAVSRDIP
jgi:cyanophycin synthetase